MRKSDKFYKKFLENEKSGGLLLISCTIISLLLANFFIGEGYVHLWHTKLGFDFWNIKLDYSLEKWINDGLMTVFFLLVGLELKREVLVGKLSNPKEAMLPIFAAIGGMIVPAGIFLMLNFGDKDTISGAGIPMATDIAFALGVLSLLGKRVPSSLRAFLAALAIIDDLGAILVIAIFYSTNLDLTNLFISLGIFVALLGCNKLKIKNLFVYIIGGIGMWYFMLHSGVHATISGVLLAAVLPFGDGGKSTLSNRIEEFLVKPVNFIVLPLFALANTAIMVAGGFVEAMLQDFSLGIAAGLIIGKPIGIFCLAFLAAKLGLGQLSKDLKWKNIFGAGILAGIGFTMSIFITLLAFDDNVIIDDAKLIILISSTIAGIIGVTVLKNQLKAKNINTQNP